MSPRLLETMRAEAGRIALLDRHLARLGSSAAAFRYPVRIEEVRGRVEAAIQRRVGVCGVRLTLGPAGDVEVESWALDDRPLRSAWIDPEPLPEAGGLLCRHKTTDRAHYRARLERARRLGADEAILINARGEVTEGTRTNVWARIDGRLWTPPLGAGGLDGVFRAHVLAKRPEAGETALLPEDLRDAEAVYLTNALRGWMPVRLVRAEPG